MPNVMTRPHPAVPLFLTNIFLLCAYLCQIQLVSAVGVNRSIDDTLGDSVTGDRPTYLPGTSGVWEDNTCAGCALAPATAKAFDGTYTAATYNPNLNNISISFDFTGTAIYVFFILANNPDPGVSASTAANFTLDGNLVSTFNHSPNSSSSAPNFYFNDSALAFSKTGMKNISHQMVISTSGLNSNYYLNFDYALYTFQNLGTSTVSSSSATSSPTDDSTSGQSDSKPVSVGAIVGGVIGGLAAVAIIGAAWFFCFRRNKKTDQYAHDDPNTVFQREIDPFILPPPPPITSSDASSTIPGSSSGPPSTFRTSTALLQSTRTGMSEGVPRTTSTLHPSAYPLDSKAAIRRQRQQELERQMQQINDEIRDLQIEAAERNAGRSDGTVSTMIMSPTGTGTGSVPSSGSQAGSSVTRSRTLRSPRSPDGKEDVSQLKAQIQAMSEHIAFLQDQQNSAWAQGLSDEPPPGYTPTVVDGQSVIDPT
ncbi:hypothetical protein FB446DRAFT_744175 [Lentinula raphanica]|nr:hypothetical protein FB446DRAFT_744175 [Lentinula raphanica]